MKQRALGCSNQPASVAGAARRRQDAPPDATGAVRRLQRRDIDHLAGGGAGDAADAQLPQPGFPSASAEGLRLGALRFGCKLDVADLSSLHLETASQRPPWSGEGNVSLMLHHQWACLFASRRRNLPLALSSSPERDHAVKVEAYSHRRAEPPLLIPHAHLTRTACDAVLASGFPVGAWN